MINYDIQALRKLYAEKPDSAEFVPPYDSRVADILSGEFEVPGHQRLIFVDRWAGFDSGLCCLKANDVTEPLSLEMAMRSVRKRQNIEPIAQDPTDDEEMSEPLSFLVQAFTLFEDPDESPETIRYNIAGFYLVNAEDLDLVPAGSPIFERASNHDDRHPLELHP